MMGMDMMTLARMLQGGGRSAQQGVRKLGNVFNPQAGLGEGAPVDPNGMFAQQGGGAPTNLLPGPAPAPKPEVNGGPRTGAEGNPFQMGMMGMKMMQNAQPERMQASDLQPMQRPQVAPPQMPQNMMPNAMRARMTQTGAGNPFMRQEQY